MIFPPSRAGTLLDKTADIMEPTCVRLAISPAPAKYFALKINLLSFLRPTTGFQETCPMIVPGVSTTVGVHVIYYILFKPPPCLSGLIIITCLLHRSPILSYHTSSTKSTRVPQQNGVCATRNPIHVTRQSAASAIIYSDWI